MPDLVSGLEAALSCRRDAGFETRNSSVNWPLIRKMENQSENCANFVATVSISIVRSDGTDSFLPRCGKNVLAFVASRERTLGRLSREIQRPAKERERGLVRNLFVFLYRNLAEGRLGSTSYKNTFPLHPSVLLSLRPCAAVVSGRGGGNAANFLNFTRRGTVSGSSGRAGRGEGREMKGRKQTRRRA